MWKDLAVVLPMILTRETAELLCTLAKLKPEHGVEHLDWLDEQHFDGEQWYVASNLLNWIDQHV